MGKVLLEHFILIFKIIYKTQKCKESANTTPTSTLLSHRRDCWAIPDWSVEISTNSKFLTSLGSFFIKAIVLKCSWVFAMQESIHFQVIKDWMNGLKQRGYLLSLFVSLSLLLSHVIRSPALEQANSLAWSCRFFLLWHSRGIVRDFSQSIISRYKILL